MPVVQATLCFVLELREFHNVDLFHRGYYQIRSYLKASGPSASPVNPAKSSVQTEPPVRWERASSRIFVPECVHPSHITPGTSGQVSTPDKMCSKILAIMYQNESVSLCDVFEQRLLLQLDPCNLEESFSKYGIRLCMELWFCESGCNPFSVPTFLEKMHTRELNIQLNLHRGLHHHFDVFFDYFHLCAIEVALHATLINITPNVISLSSSSPTMPRSPSQLSLSQQSWHDILSNVRSKTNRVQLAANMHSNICHTLLAARESMLLFWREILPYLSGRTRPHIKRTNFLSRLEDLMTCLQAQTSDEDVANQISLDVSRLSSQNAALMRQLCKSCSLQSNVASYLRRKTHQIRMKRLAEAFYCQELSAAHLLAVYDPSSVGHENLATDVRQSEYFRQIPNLPVSCRELDGDLSTIPVIFEDVFLASPPTDLLTIHSQCDLSEDVTLSEMPRPTRSAEGDLEATSNEIPNDEILPFPVANGQNHFSRTTLTQNSRRYSRSSPSLFLLEDFTNPLSLPPVLRYLGQQKRRSRGISLTGKRSIHLFALPTPNLMRDDPVKLIGFRSLDPDNPIEAPRRPVAWRSSDDQQSQFVNHLNEVPRDLRSRSSSNLPTLDARISSHLNNGSARLRHAHSLSDQLGLSESSGSPSLRSPAHQSRNKQFIALGTLRPPPTEPPGGFIPPVHLSDGLPIPIAHPGHSRTLPCRSVPDIPLAVGKKTRTLKIPHRLRKHGRSRFSLVKSRRHSVSLCGTYTNELACFSSCSEWDLTSLTSTKINDSTVGFLPTSHPLPPSTSYSSSSPSSSKYVGLHTETTRARVERSRSFTVSRTNSSVDPIVDRIGRSATYGKQPPATCDLSISDSFPHASKLVNGHDKQEDKEVIVLNSSGRREDLFSHSSNTVTQGALPSESELDYRVNTDESDEEAPRPVGKDTELLSVYDVLREESGKFVRRKQMVDPSPVPMKSSLVSTTSLSQSSYTLPVQFPDSRFTSRTTQRLADAISPEVLAFIRLKESMKQTLAPRFSGHVYSDYATVACPYPYFSDPGSNSEDLHLIVCVHGLDGNSNDLRLVRIYLELALPDSRLEFLMSECNQEDTFAGFDQLKDNLVMEVIGYISQMDEAPTRISFIGHSLGCIVIRAALTSPRLQQFAPKFHTFLSLSGPHLGVVYNTSGLVNMGIWVMQKWKKSESLAQLRLRDSADLRNTFIYRLSASPGLDLFRYVLLVGSPQDRYVPYHSTRIELCKAAIRDNSILGIVYMEMVANSLQRLIKSARTTVVRYDVHYPPNNSANSLIGRAAHIAVLDSEVFLEKFICISAAKYFR